MFGETAHVLDERAHPVLIDIGGFVGQVVAAQVWRHRQVVLAELGELILPRVPELWKPVQEQDERTLAGAHIVQPDAVHCDVIVAHAGRYGLTPAAGYPRDASNQRRDEQRGSSHLMRTRLCSRMNCCT